jgi:hypothetical protein
MAPRVALQTRGIQQKQVLFVIVTDSGERRRFSWCASLERSVYFGAMVWNARGQDARAMVRVLKGIRCTSLQ